MTQDRFLVSPLYQYQLMLTPSSRNAGLQWFYSHFFSAAVGEYMTHLCAEFQGCLADEGAFSAQQQLQVDFGQLIGTRRSTVDLLH